MLKFNKKKVSLLMVDDNSVLLEAISDEISLWEDIHITTHTEDSVTGAIKFLSSQTVDAILCDIDLSGENGVDLYKYVCKENISSAFVFLSNHTEDLRKELGSLDRVYAFLQKPFNSDQLYSLMKSIADKL